MSFRHLFQCLCSFPMCFNANSNRAADAHGDGVGVAEKRASTTFTPSSHWIQQPKSTLGEREQKGKNRKRRNKRERRKRRNKEEKGERKNERREGVKKKATKKKNYRKK